MILAKENAKYYKNTPSLKNHNIAGHVSMHFGHFSTHWEVAKVVPNIPKVCKIVRKQVHNHQNFTSPKVEKMVKMQISRQRSVTE